MQSRFLALTTLALLSLTTATSRAQSVSLTDVDNLFAQIADVKGKGSTARRDELLQALLRQVSATAVQQGQCCVRFRFQPTGR